MAKFAWRSPIALASELAHHLGKRSYDGLSHDSMLRVDWSVWADHLPEDLGYCDEYADLDERRAIWGWARENAARLGTDTLTPTLREILEQGPDGVVARTPAPRPDLAPEEIAELEAMEKRLLERLKAGEG